MSKNYKQIIDDLENAVAEIQSKGISIEPLNKAIEELKSHSKNIKSIEENIEAVKSEVMTPIKVELEQNKRAGKFSIWGFYVGAFGIIVTAISLLYTSFKQPVQMRITDTSDSTNNTVQYSYPEDYLINIDNRLKEISYAVQGLDEDYKPLSGEFLLGQFESSIVLEQDTNKLIIEAYIPGEREIDNKWYPFVVLSFF